MNDFEKGLANVMGSFMEVNLDCVEKQNQEIEQLQNNWNELKKWLKSIGLTGVVLKMQELEKGKDE